MIPPDNTARNARILELFRAGKYYSQIAAELGVSRSVVAGVCSRAKAKLERAERNARWRAAMGIEAAKAKQPKAQKPSRARHLPNLGGESAPAPKPPKDPLPPRAVFGLAAVPHDPNPMGCRYIHGHAGEPDHRYCGARRQEAGSAYCAEHYALTHIPHSSPAERRALRAIERMGGRAA